MSYLHRNLKDGERERWIGLIRLEAVLLLIVFALIIAVVVISTYYVHVRIFTDAGVIIVIGALVAEFTRRMRALFREYEKNRDA